MSDTDHLTCTKCLGSLRFAADGPIATCYDCMGLWVDTQALRNADPPIPKADALLKAVDAFDLAHASPSNLACPRCTRGDLGTQTVNGVEVDWCFDCRGLFLDRGELERLWEAAHPPSEVPVGSTKVVETGRLLPGHVTLLGLGTLERALEFLIQGIFGD